MSLNRHEFPTPATALDVTVHQIQMVSALLCIIEIMIMLRVGGGGNHLAESYVMSARLCVTDFSYLKIVI